MWASMKFLPNHQRRNRKWRNIKVCTKLYINRNPSLGAYNTLFQELPIEDAAVFKTFQVAHWSNWTFVRHFVKSGKSREYSGCLISNTCLPIVHASKKGVYQHEKVGEKVGEGRGKFYLSPSVCQYVCRLFLCRSETATWVYMPTRVCQL